MNKMSSPKAVFNGKSSKAMQQTPPNNSNGRLSPEASQHEENVLFIAEAWNRVQQEYENSRKFNREGPYYYQDKKTSTQSVRDFEPFDLEKWRERRLLDKNSRQS